MSTASDHQHPPVHTAHPIPAGQGRSARAGRIRGGWDRWSDAWTRHIAALTGRDDLSVLVAPGAGGGAPACFYPDLCRIEVDATHIGTHPDVANPYRAGHKTLVATGYGLLVHEASHAGHSHWRTPPGTPPVVAAAADQLEESRAEARHRTHRPRDRRWLRHAVTTLLDPGTAPVDDRWHAGTLAALLLARADARTLTHRDVTPVRQAVTALLGTRTVRELRQIWRHAHTVDDTDAATMIDLAWQWCRTLGIDPDQQPRTPTPDPAAFPGTLAAALDGYLAAQAGHSITDYQDARITAAHSPPAHWTAREPTAAEHAAATRLAARLRRTRHPQIGHRPHTVPPGRLHTRQAITADAQRATGAAPTAAPWQRRTTVAPPRPDLRLGMLVDVSASMRAWAGPLSSAGWILAKAAHGNQAHTATIAFAARVTLITPPRRRPTQVQQMNAAGGTSTFTDAVKLADQLLDLRHPRHARLLTVVSDGDLPDPDAAQRLITTLHHSGCGILWIRPDGMPGTTFTDTRTVTVADPITAIDRIADAALALLEHP